MSQLPAKTPGKTYSSLEVVFKNLTFQGKVEAKKILGFGAQKQAFDTLSKANAGETYEITVVKNAQGYNDWTSAVKGDGSAPAASPSAPATRAPTATPTAAPKSNYETPEERAKKQIYIVRQSSISSAIDLLSVGTKSTPDVDKVLEVASQFENFVFGNKQSDAEVAGSFFPDQPKNDPLDDDIPF